MHQHRLHFLDVHGQARVAHWFQARDDDTAYWLAERLYDACSDVYASFALRHHARRVLDRGVSGAAAPTAAQLVEQRQQMLAFHQEMLRDTACRIAESRRLLDRLRGPKTV